MCTNNPKNNVTPIDFRCTSCQSLLAKVELRAGRIEVKCKCGVMNVLEAEHVKKIEIMNKDEMQLELLKYGFSVKGAASFIERYRLCESS